MLDIDGVAVSGRPADGLPWWTDLEADLGLSVDDLQRVFFAPHWQRVVTGKTSLRETLAESLAQIAHAPDVDTVIGYWHGNDARVVPEALSLAKAAREAGHVVGFATNQDALRARYLWEELGLKHHADHMHASADLGVAKPDPAFFAAIARAHWAPADGFILADDTLANVAAALGAGWQGVHIETPTDLSKVSTILDLPI